MVLQNLHPLSTHKISSTLPNFRNHGKGLISTHVLTEDSTLCMLLSAPPTHHFVSWTFVFLEHLCLRPSFDEPFLIVFYIHLFILLLLFSSCSYCLILLFSHTTSLFLGIYPSTVLLHVLPELKQHKSY